MKNKVFLFAALIVIFVLNACSPFVITSSSGQQPTPVIETALAMGYQPMQVDQVQAEVEVGSPIPVHAIVGLGLPNTCAQLGEIRLHREGTTFYVRLIANISERADCQEDLPTGPLPFRLEIPLNIVNLPEGPYEVNVNGVTASFDPRVKPASNTDLGEFERQLQAAVTQRDAGGMRALMGERFILAHWESEGESIPSEQAVTQLIKRLQ